MITDGRFTVRTCPCCGGDERRRLFDLPLDAFCSVNWSYVPDFARVLGLPGTARFPLARCAGCGFVYAELLPSTDFLALLYDRVVRHDRDREAVETRASVARRMRYVAILLELASSERMPTALDFGCGPGATLRLFAAAGVSAVGYDPSPVRRVYVESQGLAVTATFDELRARGPFDLVVCDNVLEHIPDPGAAIRFLASVTVPGSVVFVSVPDCGDRFIESQRKLLAAGQPVDMSLNPLEHLNFFDVPHLDRLLGQGGFLPVARARLPGDVNIGLRPEPNLRNRVNNSLASAVRLARYAASTETVRTVTHEFYRRSGAGTTCAR